MFRISSFVLIIFVLFGVVGCGGSGNSPTMPTPIEQPSNIPPVTVAGGGDRSATVAFGYTTLAVGGTAKVGERVMLRVTVTNNSSEWLGIIPTISNGPNDNPGQPGRTDSVINGGFLCGSPLAPGETKQCIMGWDISGPDSVPYMRLMGYYGKTLQDAINLRTFGWSKDVELRWTFVL